MSEERRHADEGEVNAKLAAIDRTLVRLETKLDYTNGRLRKVEKFQWALTGAMALLGFISTVVIIWERAVAIGVTG